MAHRMSILESGYRTVAGRIPWRVRKLHWWARPHLVTLFCLIPLFLICAFLPDEQFLTWRHAHNFVTREAFATALAALGCFALGAKLGSLPGTKRTPSYGTGTERLIAPAQYRAILYGVFCITLASYVLLLGPVIRNPGLVQESADFHKELGKPGITSFVNLGPLYVTLLFLQPVLAGTRLSRFDRAAFCVFLIFVVMRVFVWGERLAFLEVFIPISVVRLAPMTRHRVLIAILPLFGVFGLITFFGLTEYFRSWSSFYSRTGISFADFVTNRLLGYYATAINNGALIFTTFDPLFIPYDTASWFFKLPFVPSADADSLSNLYGRMQAVYSTFANPEFTNLSGVFAPVNDFGVFVGLVIWVVLGAITGRLYLGFTTGRLMSVLLFPTWMIGVYEILRIFYWGGSRYFPLLALVPVVSWLLARSSVRYRLSAVHTLRGHGQASG